jgi:hypothetical protein
MPPFQFEPYQSRNTGTLLELIQAPARVRAAALRANGQNRAQLVANLGSLAAGIPAQIQQQKVAAQQQEMQGLQLNAARRSETDVTELDQAFKLAGDREDILNRISGHLRPTVAKLFADADEAALKVKKLKHDAEVAEFDYFGTLAAGLKPFLSGNPESDIPAVLVTLQHARENGHEVEDLWKQIQANPEALPKIIDGLIAKSPKQVELSQTAARDAQRAAHDTETAAQAAMRDAATAMDRDQDNARQASAAAETGRHNLAMEATAQQRATAAQRHDLAMEAAARLRAGTSSDTATDAKAIADAIESGDQPPELTGLYRYAGPVRAELAKRNYNFTDASVDWQATKKHVQSMNSTQQLRLRQAAETAYHSLDVIDELASKWKGGKFPVLNRVNLLAAKNGGFGEDVASVARQLEAQISDLTSELGNVYMGGNSPTDHALSLAGKNLSAEWSEKVLRDMTKLARTNLRIRLNSMNSIGAAGVTSPAAAPTATTTAPIQVGPFTVTVKP